MARGRVPHSRGRVAKPTLFAFRGSLHIFAALHYNPSSRRVMWARRGRIDSDMARLARAMLFERSSQRRT